MNVQPLAIADVKLIVPNIFCDSRGFFSETFSRRSLVDVGIDYEFVQDNHSLSADAGTIRGLHFQIPPRAQGKLLRVSNGSVWDVAVDIRRGSPTYGQHVSAILSAENWTQIWIPPGFAHGFCTLEPLTEVIYKVTDYYAPDCDRGLSWDDADLGIEWPVELSRAILSERDRKHPSLRELAPAFVDQM